MQGYNLEIRHIPGKRNPANSLSKQDEKNALGRKSVVVDANAELVQQIRIPENASDQAIQDILKQVFNAQEGNVHSDSVDAKILKIENSSNCPRTQCSRSECSYQFSFNSKCSGQADSRPRLKNSSILCV